MTPEELKELQELEELDALEKQYGKDLPATQESSAVSDTLEDVASAGAQGLTMGFSDELAGAGRGVAAKVAGSEKDLSDLYAQYRDIERKRYEQAQERSPVLSSVAEFGGAIAPSLLSGGGSLLTGGARKLAQTGLREAVKQGGVKQLAKVGGAKLGELALQGAVQGVGQSETLADAPEQAYETAKSSVAYGAPLGLAGEFFTKGSNVAAKAADNQRLDNVALRQFIGSFKEGTEGVVLNAGDTAVTRMAGEVNAPATALAGRLQEIDMSRGAALGEILEKTSASNLKINIDPQLDDVVKRVSAIIELNPNLLGKMELEKLNKQILDLSSSNMSPLAADQFREEVIALSNRLQNPDLRTVAKEFSKSLRGALEDQVPGFKQANDSFRELRKTVFDPVAINKSVGDVPAEFITDKPQFKDLNNKYSDLYKYVKGTMEQIGGPGGHRFEGATTFSGLIENVQKMEQLEPGFIKKLGYKDISDLTNSIRNDADKMAIRKSIVGAVNESAGTGVPTSVSGLATSAITKGAAPTWRGRLNAFGNVAGRATKAISEATPAVIKDIPKFTQKVFSMSDDQLKSAAIRMQQDPRLKRFGDNLINAMENKGSVGRNAVLFSMMQNPETRNAMRDFDFGLDENDEDNE